MSVWRFGHLHRRRHGWRARSSNLRPQAGGHLNRCSSSSQSSSARSTVFSSEFGPDIPVRGVNIHAELLCNLAVRAAAFRSSNASTRRSAIVSFSPRRRGGCCASVALPPDRRRSGRRGTETLGIRRRGIVSPYLWIRIAAGVTTTVRMAEAPMPFKSGACLRFLPRLTRLISKSGRDVPAQMHSGQLLLTALPLAVTGSLAGGRWWWAHVESTRMNIALTILEKEIEETLRFPREDDSSGRTP